MKYVLVNKFDEIVDTVEMPEYNRDARCTDHDDVRNYFQGVKRMPDIEEFDKLWRVMAQEEYDNYFKASLQNRQMGNRKFEWWKDDPSGPDDGFDY